MRRIRTGNKRARRKILKRSIDYVTDYWQCKVIKLDSNNVWLLPDNLAGYSTEHLSQLKFSRNLLKGLDVFVGLQLTVRCWNNRRIEIFKRPPPMVITIPFDVNPAWEAMKQTWYAAMTG